MKRNKISLLLIVTCMLLSLFPKKVTATTFPSHTEASNDVTLTKDARWVTGNGMAEVELAFDGLEYVYQQSLITDFIFVLDTSDSMGRLLGCINPEHTNYVGLYTSSKKATKLGSGWLTTLQTLIDEAINDGSLSYTYDSTEKIGRIDPNFRIEVPSSYYADGVSGPIYFVPIVATFYNVATEAAFIKQLKTGPVGNSGYFWDVIDASEPVINPPTNLAKYHIFHFEGDIATAPRSYYEFKSDNENYGYLYLFNNTYEDTFATGNVEEAPGWWDLGPNCYTRAELLYNSTSSLADKLLTNNEDARVAFVAFNTKARGTTTTGEEVISQGWQDFTSDFNIFDAQLERVVSHSGIAEDTIWNNVTFRAGQTNYSAGMLSLQKLLNDDLNKDNGHKKVVIFISDGMPNFFTTDLSNPMSDVEYNSASFTAGQAKIVAQAIFEQYPDLTMHGIALGDSTVGEVGAQVQKLLTEDGNIYLINETSQEQDVQTTFNDIYEELYEEYSVGTKLLTVTDYIDNRNFFVDQELLASNLDHKYFPDYATYTVESVVIDGVNCQKVTFTYNVDADQENVENVIIPLKINPMADGSSSDGYIPTNYDPIGTDGGARVNYKDLEGNDQTLETLKTSLPTGGVDVTKVDEQDSTKKLSNATFELYYANGEERYGTLTYSSDRDGKIEIGTLPPGDFYLLETVAPDNYKLDNTTKHSFTITTPQTTNVTMMITNELKTGNLIIGKTVTGEAPEEDSFNFTVNLTGTTTAFNYTGSKTGTISNGETVSLADGESITIEGIPVGIVYSVVESTKENYTAVEVNIAGTIGITTSYATFTNHYTAPSVTAATYQPEAIKKVDGVNATGSGYRFVLKNAGQVIQDRNNNNEEIRFDSLQFNEVGVYTYTIEEVRGNDTKINYDSSVYTLRIEVTQEGNMLQATASYTKNGEPYSGIPVFNNMTVRLPSETTNVSVSKEWKNFGHTNPESVNVQLYKNGIAFGSPITLYAGNDWKYTWTGLEIGNVWTVDEVNVPENYSKTVSVNGNHFTITNTYNKVFTKIPTRTNVRVGDIIDYIFTGFSNPYSDSLENYQIIDNPPVGLKFISGNIPAFANGEGLIYDILYSTIDGENGIIASNVDAGSSFTFNAPETSSHISAIIIRFASVPKGFGEGNSISYRFQIMDSPANELVNKGYLKFTLNGKEVTIETHNDTTVRVEIVSTGDYDRIINYYILIIISILGLIFIKKNQIKNYNHLY